MNIFELHKDPTICAEMHLDKHVVKMPTEYCQMLSTAHRILDGDHYVGKSKTGRKVQRWKLHDEREENLMLAAHVKHPDTLWVMKSRQNYIKLFFLYMATLAEYTYRYGKTHGAGNYSFWLQRPPKNIPDIGLTELPQCMPEYCKGDNVIEAYHKYYINEKKGFASWKGKVQSRPIPSWYVAGKIMEVNA